MPCQYILLSICFVNRLTAAPWSVRAKHSTAQLAIGALKKAEYASNSGGYIDRHEYVLI